jgi:hypothetical protein
MAALFTCEVSPKADAETTLAFSGDVGMHSAATLGANAVFCETV